MNAFTTRFNDFVQFSSSTTLWVISLVLLSTLIVTVRAIFLYKKNKLSKKGFFLSYGYCVSVLGFTLGITYADTSAVKMDKAIMLGEMQLVLANCAINDICYGPEKKLTIQAVNDMEDMKKKGYYSQTNLRYLIGVLSDINQIKDQERMNIINEKAESLFKHDDKPKRTIEL